MKTQPYYSVRTSKIHGRGVFAKRDIRKGTKVIEYTGPIISAEEADEVGVTTEKGHSHTMLFQVDEKRVINGNLGGDARYINHSCAPNCETVQTGDQIFIEALRAIKKGEEILYDYHLQVEEKITDKVRKEYACFCGSPECRGSQIAPDILAKQAKKDEKKKKKQEEKKIKAANKLENKKKSDLKVKAKAEEKKKKAEEKKKKADEIKKKAEEIKKKTEAEKKKAEGKSSKKNKKKTKDKKKSNSLSLMVDTKSSSKKEKKNKKKDKKK